jgi:hypothetical protein
MAGKTHLDGVYYSYKEALLAAGGDASKIKDGSTSHANWWYIPRASNNVNTTSKTIWKDVFADVENDLGFDPIPICRPQFIKFHFKGLKPNTRHYFFVNGRDMTSYTSTNATQISNYENASRGNEYRDPGERYITASAWPLANGTTGGYITSTSAGEIEGIFYLQRNETTFFSTGEITINISDVSDNNYANSLSYASASFTAGGRVDYSYYTPYISGQVEVTNPNYVAPVVTNPSSSGSSKNKGNNNYERDDDNGGDNDHYYGSGSSVDLPGNVISRALGIEYDADGDGDTTDGDDGCVIATHAVSTGAFTKYEKARAVVWCENVLHDKWWGDVIRRGYRYLGRKKIEQGVAHKYYKDFKDYIDFARGKNRSIKNGIKFISYTTRFVFAGVFLASKND